MCSTAGELVQVRNPDMDVHVSAPVDVFNRYAFAPRPGAETLGTKARAAAERCLALGQSRLEPRPMFVVREGVISAGMGTSTADTIAAALTHARLARLDLEREQLARVVSSVERSDGIFYDGVCLVQQGVGRLLKRFPAPAWRLLLLIPKTRLATENARPYSRRFSRAYAEILNTILTDISEDDFINCVNLSAELNARVRDYEFYFDVKRMAKRFRADGVGIAHTGSVVFLIYKGSAEFDSCRTRLIEVLKARYALDRIIAARFVRKSWDWL
ncbi:MAG: hypothetical protein AAGA95_03165 [Pseudomonadota bacterium]